MQFSDLSLSPTTLRAVQESGYTEPTPIQAQAIPAVLAGRDVLGIAQTGTGKTAAYTLPMVTLLAQGRARARMPRSLVLCPTRELAAQVADSIQTYGQYDRLVHALLIGGVSFGEQIRRLDRGADVLIATPGRLIDLFERGRVMLGGVQIAVIDEADRMLDMGFIPDIEKIVRLLPFTRQTMLFSATMPTDIARLADEFLQNPLRIEVSPPATTVERVAQSVLRVGRHQADRLDALCYLLKKYADELTNGIVFCNRKRTVGDLFVALKRKRFNVAALHGDLDQHTRMATLNSFRNDEIQLLIASDVAARGLDIPLVSHVFNFDVPLSPDDYVHRIGRTARAGRPGVAVTICDRTEAELLGRIEKLIGQHLTIMTDPEPPEYKSAAGSRTDGRARAAAENDDAPPRARSRQRPPPTRLDRASHERERQPEPRRTHRRAQPESEERDTVTESSRTANASPTVAPPPGRARRTQTSEQPPARRSMPPRQPTSRGAVRSTAPESPPADTEQFLPAFLTKRIPIKTTTDDVS